MVAPGNASLTKRSPTARARTYGDSDPGSAPIPDRWTSRRTPAIAEARAHGDLSENAEYDAAKERQGFIEARIAELESKLADARVVEIARRNSDTVVFGATVSVIEQESQAKRQYTLVGQDEADMKFNRISIQSPVGRALIGKRVGDFIEVKTPVKTVEYEVVEIRFEEL